MNPTTQDRSAEAEKPEFSDSHRKARIRPGCSGSLLLDAFPLGDRSRDDAKQGMCCRNRQVKMAPIDRRAAPLQFAQQPAPFVLQLAVGRADALHASGSAKFRAIECVTSSTGLVVDESKVTVHGSARCRTGPEPRELRMLAISDGASAKHLAGEQRLAPEGDQSLCVEIPGMKRPQAHRVSCGSTIHATRVHRYPVRWHADAAAAGHMLLRAALLEASDSHASASLSEG